ncbi:hypothetical protein SDC9_135199 [bioreactor metagenome]|uniref:Uncharacterized protein n=1 Tax=bioreactor metagenome TaxID=1076179 RepID=A0A645DGD1_9ZZZZ
MDAMLEPTHDTKKPFHIPRTKAFAKTIAKSGNTGANVSTATNKSPITAANNL